MFKLVENWSLYHIAHFDDILDVRSPAEYALDHLPQSLNFPVLDNAERTRVGILYKKVSSFEAKKQGAALVASHIASHIEKHLADKTEGWQPLVYCWRGGTRSAAMVHILNNIGWQAQQLPGGYKAYRRRVIDTIAELAPRLRFVVLCGKTGVGKTRLLEALHRHRKQVIDLEKIANHKGSVLGEPTEGEQPSQKCFETKLCHTMRALDPKQTVYVEAESPKIGRIQIPTVLLDAMHRGRCLRIEAAMSARVAFLCEEYRHFLHDPELFQSAIARLAAHVAKKKIEHWLFLHKAEEIAELVEDLLVSHYDPFYTRSMNKHFKHYQNINTAIQLNSIAEVNLAEAVADIEQM